MIGHQRTLLFQWTRDRLARKIGAEHGEMPEKQLKWHLVLQLDERMFSRWNRSKNSSRLLTAE